MNCNHVTVKLRLERRTIGNIRAVMPRWECEECRALFSPIAELVEGSDMFTQREVMTQADWDSLVKSSSEIL